MPAAQAGASSQSGEVAVDTDAYPSDFGRIPELRDQFLNDVAVELAEERGWPSTANLKLSIERVDKLTWDGSAPRVYVRVARAGGTGNDAEATFVLEDYDPSKHDEVLRNILGEISAANGWDPAELQIVEARQLADDHDGSLPKPPPKKSLGSGLYTGLMKRMGRSSTRKSNGAEESTSNTA